MTIKKITRGHFSVQLHNHSIEVIRVPGNGWGVFNEGTMMSDRLFASKSDAIANAQFVLENRILDETLAALPITDDVQEMEQYARLEVLEIDGDEEYVIWLNIGPEWVRVSDPLPFDRCWESYIVLFQGLVDEDEAQYDEQGGLINRIFNWIARV